MINFDRRQYGPSFRIAKELARRARDDWRDWVKVIDASMADHQRIASPLTSLADHYRRLGWAGDGAEHLATVKRDGWALITQHGRWYWILSASAPWWVRPRFLMPRCASCIAADRYDCGCRPLNDVTAGMRIYVLVLEGDRNYYVGASATPMLRFEQHSTARNGALWTGINKPLRIRDVWTVPTASFRAMEDAVTLDLMRVYGVEHVQGGRFTGEGGLRRAELVLDREDEFPRAPRRINLTFAELAEELKREADEAPPAPGRRQLTGSSSSGGVSTHGDHVPWPAVERGDGMSVPTANTATLATLRGDETAMNTMRTLTSEEIYDDLAQMLDATGDYRVLRRLKPFEPTPAEEGAATWTGLVVDTETTGTDPERDEIIEIAMLRFRYGDDGRIVGAGEAWQGLRQPSLPIPPEATAVNGITDAMVAGQTIDPDEVAAFIASADLIVAHNAAFDRPFLERFCPAFQAQAVRLLDGRDRLAGGGARGPEARLSRQRPRLLPRPSSRPGRLPRHPRSAVADPAQERDPGDGRPAGAGEGAALADLGPWRAVRGERPAQAPGLPLA